MLKLAVIFCFVALTLATPVEKLPSFAFGKKLNPGDYPFLVSIYTASTGGSDIFFPGALISLTTVLTSADNFRFETYPNYTVTLGAYNPKMAEPGQQKYLVGREAIIVHPGFNGSVRYSENIGLIRLPTPAILTSTVQLAPLVPRQAVGETFEDYTSYVIGWNNDRVYTVYEQETVLKDESCQMNPKNYQVCHTGRAGAGPRSIDYGAPMLVDYQGRRIVIGTLTFVYSDQDFNEPDLFVRLTSFIDWIEQNSDVRFP